MSTGSRKIVLLMGIVVLLFPFAEFMLRVTLYRTPAEIENIPVSYRTDNAAPWIYRRDKIQQVNGDFGWMPKPGYKRKHMLPSREELWGGNSELGLYEVVINSRGIRGDEFFIKKGKDTFRIVCMGDSWTFGVRVNGPDTYPEKLEDFLNIEFPDRHIEVLNLGVPGYTSLQGLRLFQKKVLDLNPDMILLGFNTNDARPPFLNTKNDTHMLESRKKFMFFETLYRYSKVLEVLAYYRRKFIGSPRPKMIMKKADTLWWDFNTRNTAEEYRRNITEMVRIAKENAIEPILLHTAGYYPYNFVLSQLIQVRKQENIVLVNVQPLLHKRLKKVQIEVEKRFGLDTEKGQDLPSGNDKKEEIVFHVYFPEENVSSRLKPEGRPDMGVVIRTTRGDRHLPLYDDGTHGDQRAGDQVWSTTYRFTPVEQHRVVQYVDEDGTHFRTVFLYYVFTFRSRANKVYYEFYSGGRGIDVPRNIEKWRTILIDSAERSRFISYDYRSPGLEKIYTPVHTFWHRYDTSDHIGHPSAKGYQLIAHELFKAVKSSRSFIAYLERTKEWR